jgi:hypothetical protein
VFGVTVHLVMAGLATVAVVGPVDAAVGCVVVTEAGPEDVGAVVWSALRDA